ncbi:metal-dependent transcriptional regulator [Halarchaeum acidiphilum]|nr:metal-dependent transcriptional regulator [Halarchaeum acidiphilum]
MLSDVMEDYLKATYVLQREGGPPVRTSDLAEYLGVTPPTVTSMLEKLADRELVEREKYKGVELSDEGETVALEILRHHRLLESYLAEHLDYDWSEVHEEADALEHHISEAFERRVANALGEPRVDPHGDPIPTEELAPLADDDTAALADIEEGETVTVARVSDRDDEHLAYLAERGIEPGAELDVVTVAPIDMVTVHVEGDEIHLPTAIAASIRVERETRATA